MNDNEREIPSPDECTSRIFELSGTRFDPDIAANLWLQILNHKWLLSEKVGRDVGFRTACIDFLENM
jgi:transitional endoplasmic reticulum ATPase